MRIIITGGTDGTNCYSQSNIQFAKLVDLHYTLYTRAITITSDENNDH